MNVMHTCHCGCETFRMLLEDSDKNIHENICRNCKHTLAEHLRIVKQAE